MGHSGDAADIRIAGLRGMRDMSRDAGDSDGADNNYGDNCHEIRRMQ